ncbi:MAG: adenine deaminase [Candidatus Marinimicrobia bacterium]|nr:adenine deaminase [Candidatus Neomarinimicrobiota bacterium]
MKTLSANIVDVLNERIFPGTLTLADGHIASIVEDEGSYGQYIIPGFVDAHIHIESSMLVPSEFARIALRHGTAAVVSDPHEIANVLGTDGIRFMIDNAKTSPLKFYFSVPSCVPATPFETAGARIDAEETGRLFHNNPEIKFLGEVMNVPGVLNADPEVMKKIELAKAYGERIDGHAPGLRGDDLKKYVNAGIETDHECVTPDEALEKLSLGMKVFIREGSAAKDFDQLIPIAKEHYKDCAFCSDDKHPDDLLKGHINELVKRALAYGLDLMKVLRMACVNPVLHYGLDVGLLQEGDPADFLVIDDPEHMNILKTVIGGKVVFENGKTRFPRPRVTCINNFQSRLKSDRDFFVENRYEKSPVIEVVDGQLITQRSLRQIMIENHNLVSDVRNDILKIAVINRYEDKKPALAFVRGFGLKRGAIASSVAHDSHNVIVVGVSESDMAAAVNLIIAEKGGISAVCAKENISRILPLPVAGLMSDKHYDAVARTYSELDAIAKEFASPLTAPFMTLSFMALLVIPEIKLSDKGLFDGVNFTFIGT